MYQTIIKLWIDTFISIIVSIIAPAFMIGAIIALPFCAFNALFYGKMVLKSKCIRHLLKRLKEKYHGKDNPEKHI